MMHKKDTINLYMSSTLKFYGMAYQGLEQYDKAASYFERLSVLRDSLRVRELRSSSQELSIIYDVKDKEAQITHQRWELVIAICILIALAIIGCVLGYNNRIIRKKNISLVANVKEAMRYKEELEKLNRSTLSENIAWNDDEDPDLLLFEQIKVKSLIRNSSSTTLSPARRSWANSIFLLTSSPACSVSSQVKVSANISTICASNM